MSVVVSADDDVEVRKLTILNRTRRRRYLEFTSYAEFALAPHAADAAHAAFSKMFVETETDGGVLIAHRRLRAPDDSPLWVAHMLVGATGNVEFETDRQTFIGRARSIATAAGLDRSLNASVGATLDPIASLRCRETLEPRGKTEFSFVTIAASSHGRRSAQADHEISASGIRCTRAGPCLDPRTAGVSPPANRRGCST